MKLLRFLSENRWPLYLSGLLAMAISAYAVLIFVATRPNAPRPIPRYYESSQRWDADEAVEAASRQLGWSVSFDLPAGVPHVAGMPRPIDVRVVDRNGAGVTDLAGRLLRGAGLRRTAEPVDPAGRAAARGGPLPGTAARRPARRLGVPHRRQQGRRCASCTPRA